MRCFGDVVSEWKAGSSMIFKKFAGLILNKMAKRTGIPVRDMVGRYSQCFEVPEVKKTETTYESSNFDITGPLGLPWSEKSDERVLFHDTYDPNLHQKALWTQLQNGIISQETYDIAIAEWERRIKLVNIAVQCGKGSNPEFVVDQILKESKSYPREMMVWNPYGPKVKRFVYAEFVVDGNVRYATRFNVFDFAEEISSDVD